ncbi:succinate dehydrogenase, hydrophobic membrane anchor protein [Algiphilus sp. W345]|uniref:Succinate dehydrogenase hydrophobic membrane anchor subunit n=1 Tax=Banduia mediterranea TaxID=3075609 RepID=A0ABU2WL81_9GAMM|nr:succinate dehydrogenase, hydrophobic membrane anchor protein [Algiphilus sp. W345]MDT0498626.1 succinate dehydrogenase, hydrophobic membrane anchor protein [Algiphilus sp. W345]
MSIRSPLSRARGLGSAKDGVQHWWVQRVSAVALVPLVIWFMYSVAGMSDAPYLEFVSWVRQPWVTVLLVLFIGTTLYHSALGLQVVLEDYVSGEFKKIASIIAVKLACAVLAVAAIFAVLKIAFGSI